MCGQGSLLAVTAATGRAYFRSAPPPAATRTAKVSLTRTPAFDHSWSSRPTRSSVYLDWRRRQEVRVLAAALSGDQALIDAYRDGDVYHALALVCGLTNDRDAKRWKAENPQTRQRMKSLQLAINYGMGVPSLAKGLNRHPLIASHIIELHRRTYPRYWEWRQERAQTAMLDRQLETQFGWRLYLSNSPNKRTLYNFPMQGNGAEMLRLAALAIMRSRHCPKHVEFMTVYCSRCPTRSRLHKLWRS